MSGLPRPALCAHRSRPCGGPCPEGGPCVPECVPCHPNRQPTSGVAAFEIALDEFADDLDHGFTPTGYTARLVDLWVDDTDKRTVVQALVDAIDAILCDGNCGAFLAHETVGETFWCGQAFHYCPDCWADAPRGCSHPEHMGDD